MQAQSSQISIALSSGNHLANPVYGRLLAVVFGIAALLNKLR
jgi:hypothetical protein